MAQYKTYKLSERGDTINAVDKNGVKQGKWINHVEELRGEPGYEEEGIFKEGKREGVWRIFSLTGDLIATESYLNGGKDGLQRYFTNLGDLVREENWRGYNPEKPYDTIAVYGTGSNEIISTKIVKVQPYSVKHGDWKFFDPSTGKLIKSETYDHGLLIKPDSIAANAPSVNKPKKIDKTPEMIEWEKKNKGKKKAYRDGNTMQ